MQAKLNLHKKAAKLTKNQASRAWSCPTEGCGAGGIGGTGQRKLHLQCYCKKLTLPWPQACPACGKLMGDPHVLKQAAPAQELQEGGEAARGHQSKTRSTVVTVIGDHTTVNMGTPVLANTVDPQQGQS